MAIHISMDTEGMEDKVCDRPVRLLHKPSMAELNNLKGILRRATKAELQAKAKPFLKLLEKYRFRYNDIDGGGIPLQITLFEKAKTQPKEAWVELLALFYYGQNYSIIFDDMPKREIDLWHEVVRNHFLIDKETNRIMRKECFTESNWYYDDVTLAKPLDSYFIVTNKKGDLNEYGARRRSNFIYVDSPRQLMLLKEFFPDLINIRGLDVLPEDKELKVYNGESLVFSKLPMLASLYDNGVLPHAYAKLTGATVKKIQKILTLPDFFQAYPDTKQPALSTGLMANHYLFYRVGMGHKKLPTSPEILVKEIFNHIYKVNAYTLTVQLPYVKGVKKSLINSSSISFVITMALSLVKTHHEKGWLPLDAIIMKIRTFDVFSENRFLLFETFFFDKMDMRNGYADEDYIHIGNLIRQISEPFVKSLMFLLATFGIVEIAYREPDGNDASYYDGLQYVRLTELGKYVFEMTQDYIPHVAEDSRPAFELDDQRLLIKVVRTDSPLVPLLKDFAENISPTLYRVSYENFLKGCTDAESVKQKIRLFSLYICKEQPTIWRQFFKELTERIHPFLTPDDKYTILRLSPDDRKLQHLILTEPSLRRYVLKAENFMLLVKTDNVKPLANAMRKFGYLM